MHPYVVALANGASRLEVEQNCENPTQMCRDVLEGESVNFHEPRTCTNVSCSDRAMRSIESMAHR